MWTIPCLLLQLPANPVLKKNLWCLSFCRRCWTLLLAKLDPMVEVKTKLGFFFCHFVLLHPFGQCYFNIGFWEEWNSSQNWASFQTRINILLIRGSWNYKPKIKQDDHRYNKGPAQFHSYLKSIPRTTHRIHWSENSHSFFTQGYKPSFLLKSQLTILKMEHH